VTDCPCLILRCVADFISRSPNLTQSYIPFYGGNNTDVSFRGETSEKRYTFPGTSYSTTPFPLFTRSQ
jgi:hypothetical protein